METMLVRPVDSCSNGCRLNECIKPGNFMQPWKITLYSKSEVRVVSRLYSPHKLKCLRPRSRCNSHFLD